MSPKMLGFSKGCMNIAMNESSFFVRPSPAPEEIPSDDPLIHGTLQLSLPKARRFRSIAVRLMRFHNLSFPDNGFYEQGETVISEVKIQDSGECRQYEKGEHTFAFTLVIPSTTAPFERCQFGRIYHKVVAYAEGESLIASGIEAEFPIWIVANPSAAGEMSDFQMRFEGHNEEIGPYAVSTVAQHLTVGGLLHFDIQLPSVPAPIEILSVSGILVQDYTIKSIQVPRRPPSKTTKKTPLFRLTGSSTLSEQDTDITLTPFQGTAQRITNGATYDSAIVEPLSRLDSLSPSSSRTATSSDSAGSTPATSPSASPTIGTSVLAGFRSRRSSPPPTSSPPAQSKKPLPPTSSAHGSTKNAPLVSRMRAGDAFRLEHLARLPSDDIIRPGTLPGTTTPIASEQRLVVEVAFRTLDLATGKPKKGDVRILRCNRPITIVSCCCMLESLLLPAYTEALQQDAKTIEPLLSGSKAWTKFSNECVCCQSKETLIAKQRAVGHDFERRCHSQVKAEHTP